jgi:hypothetical protein
MIIKVNSHYSLTLKIALEESIKLRTFLEVTLHLKIVIIQSELGGIDELSYNNQLFQLSVVIDCTRF